MVLIIQPIATQISKLRFFISLIVDQKIDREKDNFGIRPLPNLETKFVTANTLIGLDKPDVDYGKKDMFSDPEIIILEKELKRVRHKLFSAKTPKTKSKLRKKDEEIRNQIAKLLENIGWAHKTATDLASWDPYNQNGSSSFFDSQWMFDIEGFDVVIGNPPYIQIQKFSGQQCQKDWEAQNYKTFAKTGDIYSLFYEKGNMVLRDGGHLCFITSNKWMRANYGKATRDYFAKNTNPEKLIDFGGFKVFESATVDTNILLFAKGQNRHSTLACTMQKDFSSKTPIEIYLEMNGVVIDNLTSNSWIIMNSKEAKIKKRIEDVGTLLKEWNLSINFGIKTGFNEAFIIDGSTKDRLIEEDPKSEDIIKPVLRGRDVKRYKAEFADLWLINSHNGYKHSPVIDIHDYPAIRSHLDKYWDKISKRSDKGVTPYNLRNCAYIDDFEKEKIVWKRIGSKIRFSLSMNYELCLDSTCIATGERIKFLTVLLNSTIHLKDLISIAPKTGTGDAIISVQALEPLYVYRPTKNEAISFETLADYILHLKQEDEKLKSKYFENLIDGIVFELYFLQEVKDANKELLIHLQELPQITDTMTSEEKSGIIDSTFEILSDPNHVVKNNLKGLDCIEEWRIISGLEG